MKKKKYLILISTFILLITLFLLWKFFISEYYTNTNIKLIGKDTVSINYKDTYKEQGYIATIDNKKVNNKVKIENNINYKKIGTYEIKYTITNNKGKNKKTIVRKINIIDNIPPTISLIGDSTITIYKGDNYTEQGIKAIDEYDGDISKNVVVEGKVDTNTIGDYILTYKIKDSSNNESVIKRTVKVQIKSINTSGIPILMYHFFYDSAAGEKAKDSNYIDIALFEQEIKYLKENNYYFPSWEELENYIDNKITLPSKSIIITVDDGAESFFRLAYPILKKYNIKATSFIVTSWTDPKNADVDRSIVDFQSHSNNMHRGGCSTGHGGIFLCISYNEGYSDLITSINITGSKDVFAYPFGDYNDNAIKMLKDAGFHLAVTTNYGKVKPGLNKYTLPRIRVNGTTSFNSFIESIK